MNLTEVEQDAIDDAIEDAMAQHESQNSDSVCTCGVVNNMDGDVLFSHRVGAVSAAVHDAILGLRIVGNR